MAAVVIARPVRQAVLPEHFEVSWKQVLNVQPDPYMGCTPKGHGSDVSGDLLSSGQ